MTIEIRELGEIKTLGTTTSIVVLPTNFQDEPTSHQYHSNTLSFYKYARSELGLTYLSEPKKLFEQRSSEWFAPILLISHQLISENPTIVSIICGVISNYITSVFRGESEPAVYLRVICEKTKSSKYVEITYKGNADGLIAIQDAVTKAVENEQP
jgi:hypothetical protein